MPAWMTSRKHTAFDRHADVGCEIVGADQQHIDAVDGRDLVNPVDRRLRLDRGVAASTAAVAALDGTVRKSKNGRADEMPLSPRGA